MAGFELESILNYREYVEKQIKNELAGIESLLRREREKYQTKTDKKDQAEKKIQHLINRGASISQCRIHFEYIEKLNQCLHSQKKIIHEIELQVHQKREELIIAMKEKKLMQKLKEKKMQAINYLKKKKETSKLDDFSAGTYIRNKDKI